MVVRARHRPIQCTFNKTQVPTRAWPPRAFTLIEMLVVMAGFSLLLTLALARYFFTVGRRQEAGLKQKPAEKGDPIDKYYNDRGRYPDSLPELCTRHNIFS